MSNPKYAVWLWEKFGKHFQSSYDKIRAWELPEEIDELFETLWSVLSPEIKKTIWSLLNRMYKDFGPDRAKEVLAAILKELGKIFNIDEYDGGE